jgi:hypothetical protein
LVEHDVNRRALSSDLLAVYEFVFHYALSHSTSEVGVWLGKAERHFKLLELLGDLGLCRREVPLMVVLSVGLLYCCLSVETIVLFTVHCYQVVEPCSCWLLSISFVLRRRSLVSGQLLKHLFLAHVDTDLLGAFRVFSFIEGLLQRIRLSLLSL